MPTLVGFTGFGGAGKTTAMEYLQEQGFGRRVYLGQAVLDEIDRRNIKRTPEVEEAVRIELRSKNGPGAFADLRVSSIAELISKGESVFIDAIFNVEEYRKLQTCNQDRSVLVAIKASFETRARRLMARDYRRYTPDELRKRDQTETGDLGTTAVLQMADLTLSNEGSFADLYTALTALWMQIASS
jgi:dephospho-CoA kinase